MTIDKLMVMPVDSDLRWWLRVGGLAAMVLGLSYIIITVVYTLGGTLPQGAEEWLKHLARHTLEWWVILGLSVFTDLLFIPTAVALYLALKAVNKNAMLVGCGLLILFVILDLAITWPNYAALITLSGDYGAATNDAQRALLIAAASYPAAILASTLLGVYIILVPAIGIFIIGRVMLNSFFNKAAAYSGLGAGLLGIVAVVGPFFVTALGLFAVFSSVLTTVWVLLLGYQLYRLSRE